MNAETVATGRALTDEEFILLYCQDGGPVVDALIERMAALADRVRVLEDGLSDEDEIDDAIDRASRAEGKLAELIEAVAATCTFAQIERLAKQCRWSRFPSWTEGAA